MSTKIFGVEYWITNAHNGRKGSPFKESKNVVAKDALDAIVRVKKELSKEWTYKDEEQNNKVVKVTLAEFEPLNVILRASTD